MSRPRDLVELAVGNVRVPVTELTMEERLNLFQVFASLISGHYYISSPGGALFKRWEIQTLERGRMLINSSGLRLPLKLEPEHDTYHNEKRLVVLGFREFDLPHPSPHMAKSWQTGARIGFCRICLTNKGSLWFEWYEGTVGKNAVSAEVEVANYEAVSTQERGTLPEKLTLLLEKDPYLLSQFCHLTLELINNDATMREERAKRDRALFNRLSEIGKPFDITVYR